MKKSPDKKVKTRLPLLLAGLFFLLWASAVVIAVGETFSRGHENNEAADPAFPGEGKGAGVRYPILDRNRRELAVSFPVKSVYVKPMEVEDPSATAGLLARELGLEEKSLQLKLREERGYFWVGRQFPEEAGEKVRAANLKGVYVVDEIQRYYPQETLAAHVVGFVGDGHGLEGIEAKYDRILQGATGPLDQEAKGEVRGPLVLTLDLRAQDLLEKQLAHLVEATAATSGGGLVLEAGSGGILALASNPTYDPNFFWDYDEKGRANRVVAPGLPAAGFRNLFRLAASYREGARAGQGGGGETAMLSALKSELKLDHMLEKGGGSPDRLVKQGEVFLSPSLASLEGHDEVGDFPKFCRELGLTGRQPLPEEGAEQPGPPDDPFRPTGLGLLSGLASMLSPAAPVPHLLAGVLDESTGQLRQGVTPAKSAVQGAAVEKMLGFFQGLPRESGGVTILEVLTPVPADEAQGTSDKMANPDNPVAEQGKAGADKDKSSSSKEKSSTSKGKAGGAGKNKRNTDKDKANQQAEEPSRFSTLLVAVLVAEKSPPLLMLLTLEGAQVDPTLKTPMALVAEKVLPMARGWASEAPSASIWKPREKVWQAEWRNLQTARAAKNQENSGVDRRLMPDLQGLSLRKALQALNRYGLTVRVQGTGQVSRQKPGPGEKIIGGKCQLILAGLR